MSIRRWILALIAVSAGVATWLAWPHREEFLVEAMPLVEPGHLSRAHAFLEKRCDACHTANVGVEAANCIACHANDQALLQRQPTAFHAHVSSCTECHAEHRGFDVRRTVMDHAALASIGVRQLRSDSNTRRSIAEFVAGLPITADSDPAVSTRASQEATLRCDACHGKQDHHAKLFGTDCGQCHGVDRWQIPGFRHPAPTSQDCAQCHQAPPSHSMMHFQMVSMRVAGQEHARVDQCFLCHQTTSWNDIRGVGWYKHH